MRRRDWEGVARFSAVTLILLLTGAVGDARAAGWADSFFSEAGTTSDRSRAAERSGTTFVLTNRLERAGDDPQRPRLVRVHHRSRGHLARGARAVGGRSRPRWTRGTSSARRRRRSTSAW